MDPIDGEFGGGFGRQMSENEAQSRFLPFLLPLLGGAVGGGLLSNVFERGNNKFPENK